MAPKTRCKTIRKKMLVSAMVQTRFSGGNSPLDRSSQRLTAT